MHDTTADGGEELTGGNVDERQAGRIQIAGRRDRRDAPRQLAVVTGAH